MEKIKNYILENIQDQHFDCVAVGVIDFEKGDFETFQYSLDPVLESENLFFDLASITKVLTFASAYLDSPDIFTKEMLLLLDHRSGLPRWGRLSQNSWREQVLGYDIKESDTVYSDFGALRLQLEIEKASKKHLYEISSKYWDEEIKHWHDLEFEYCPFTGMRRGFFINGVVHDDNAFVINEKLSHAGLFGSVKGLCQTMLNLDSKLDLLKRIGVDSTQRFNKGWDTVTDPSNTLAGEGCSSKTFGHLGFTGTSVWIDPEKRKGHVILTNETLGYWYSREKLSKFRKDIGKLVFS